MIIKPMIRNNICMNAHPEGCRRDVLDQIAYVQRQGPVENGPKRALIIGGSTGYGLASRIVAGFGSGAKTLSVSFEKEPSEKRPGTMGWYNTASYEQEAAKAGLYAKSLNGDAFSNEMKQQVIQTIKDDLGDVDLVVYSLASPVRTDPQSGDVYRSVLKPIGSAFSAKSINPQTGEIKEFSIEPASDEEVEQTVKVMGGEDWILWMSALKQAGVLAKGVRTVAYSYIGPEVTRAVYRDGTIGKAKEHLERSAGEITQTLSDIQGEAYVSVNKALVTRASAVIPVVPLYLALLFKVMKEKGIHEGCIEQMDRLFRDRLGKKPVPVDEEGRIRMDDWEMRQDVQDRVNELWPQVTSESIRELGDLEGYNQDFLAIHGFGRADVNYDEDVSTVL
ncbi:enoyl-ACP reductase FabV [Spirochaeta lutea]|uniref:Trans-2-enoyl-CoA reductase [NADH] n=1 Tax=Spirochaeta lutea TaxID=1480694 RepID=A0A098QV08_9SPIO|nr:enoyl-ACP reductase FabV [Spirochaeta lutea]KGE71376.1 trans-2-enoyl-CoA reductase [Spirochaeta lutea]